MMLELGGGSMNESRLSLRIFYINLKVQCLEYEV